MEDLINRSVVLPNDDETTRKYAELRNACKQQGHPLQQKQHLADLWIAASAVRWQIPLVTHDAGFIGCPGLDLITELPRQQPEVTAAPAIGARIDRGTARVADR